MRIAFRVDASPLIGGGHTMRCLTLADALRADGAETAFVSGEMPPSLASRIKAGGHALLMIASLPPGARGPDWHKHPLPAQAQETDWENSAAALTKDTDWMVIDNYRLDAYWHKAARARCGKILVIDDLANRAINCDLLLDQNLGREGSDYAGLLSVGARVLSGANYALLRPDFARERPAALKRRRKTRSVRRILVSLGTTDVGGITADAVETALGIVPEALIDVATGAETGSLSRLRGLGSRVTVHVDTDDMAPLMRDADLAIGAPGITSWERCCLGLPAVTVVVAENQRSLARALDDAGASVTISETMLAEMLAKLVGDADLRASMAAAAFAIVDGRGTERVMAEIRGDACTGSVAAAISFRPACLRDAEALWLWRNDPVTRTVSRTVGPILWINHLAWLEALLTDSGTSLTIAEEGGKAFGVVRFDPLPNARHEISINVAPEFRGSGKGKMLLEAACAQFAAAHPSRPLVAAVHLGNVRSQKLFTGCGFKAHPGSGEDGFKRYVLQGERPLSAAGA